jgi:hypothetical protein
MMLFSRFREDLGGVQKDRSLTAIFVGEIACLPPHNSECGHSRPMVALMQNFLPAAK